MKLLNYICALLLLLCGYGLNAQDVITFSSGEEVTATITEVNDLKIKYKLFNSTDTTIHTAKVNSVFMIKYANGTKQVIGNTAPTYSQEVDKIADREIAKLKAQSTYAKYSRIYEKKKRVGIVCTAIGAPLLLVGVPMAIVGDVRDGGLNGSGGALMAAGTLCSAAGLALTIVGAINLGVMPKYKKKRDDAAAQLSLYPVTGSIQSVGNVGGSYSGMAMRITF